MSSTQHSQGPQNSAKAVWSMVLGIGSFFACGCLAGIPAIVLGFMAKSDIKRQPTALTGEGMALAGIILGFVNLALMALVVPLMVAIAVPGFVRARSQSRMKSCQENLVRIDGAKEQFALEHSKKEGDPVTQEDIVGYLHMFPNEPSGYSYVIGEIGKAPACTSGIAGHSLEEVGVPITSFEPSGNPATP